MDGRATLTTETSSTTMNWPRQTRSNTNPGAAVNRAPTRRISAVTLSPAACPLIRSSPSLVLKFDADRTMEIR